MAILQRLATPYTGAVTKPFSAEITIGWVSKDKISAYQKLTDLVFLRDRGPPKGGVKESVQRLKDLNRNLGPKLPASEIDIVRKQQLEGEVLASLFVSAEEQASIRSEFAKDQTERGEIPSQIQGLRAGIERLGEADYLAGAPGNLFSLEAKILEASGSSSDPFSSGITVGSRTLIGRETEAQIRQDLFYSGKDPLALKKQAAAKQLLGTKTKFGIEDVMTSIYKKHIQNKSSLDIFNYLEDNYPEVYKSIDNKGRNIIITRPILKGLDIDSKIPTAVIKFPENFVKTGNVFIKKPISPPNKPNFNLNFEIYIRTGFLNIVRTALSNATISQASEIQGDVFKSFSERVKEIDKLKPGTVYQYTPRDKDIQPNAVVVRMFEQSGYARKSIPMGRVKSIPRLEKGAAFTSRREPVRRILRETRPSVGDFITDDTLTALTKREMLRRMPIGPVGGPPLSTRVLTFRTGRFTDSVKVFQDIRNRQISYYYSPNYWTHETTSRDPRNLIRTSINSVVRSVFSTRFNVVKSNADK